MKNTGVKFEQKVFEILQEEINEESLGLIPNCCKIFTQKGYYSKDREKDIKTDISIEVYVANSLEPFFIWIWECKDYKKQIPVDDIEEFHAKLEQIGSDKTKGTVITSLGSFQESSMKYAASKGIGLARLMPDDQVNWYMHTMLPHMNSYNNKNNAMKALSYLSYIAEEHNFFGLTSDSKLTREQYFSDYILQEFKLMLKTYKMFEGISKKN